MQIVQDATENNTDDSKWLEVWGGEPEEANTYSMRDEDYGEDDISFDDEEEI
jgi:hypothetical protein